MKKFHILLFTIPILFFILIYLSIWWFIGGMAAILIFITYQVFAERLSASVSRGEILELELEELHVRLENAVVKEQKTSKEVIQVKEIKQQLLSVIGHEIRTPMNGVLGMSLLMADTPLTQEQQEYLNTIRNCSESLLTTVNNLLVNDILDFSKLQQEGNKLECKDFDLRDSVEEVMDLFTLKSGKTGPELVYEIAEDVPEQIIGDSKRLRQVLINLIENAVKFTPKGEVFLSIQYILPTVPGYTPELQFNLQDTGIGIAKEQIKQLFKGIPGKQIQNKNGKDAAGLGLVVCRKLVELMGGQINAISQEGQGSTFTFTLPLIPSLKSPRHHAHFASMSILEGKQILIVEDNPTQRTILVKQMKYWKMVPLAAETGKQAMEILSWNSTIDLVLTDVDMPEMNGVQLATSINQLSPSIPVIGMNVALDFLSKEETGIFSAIFTKPIRQQILRDHIIRSLSKTNTGKQSNEIKLTDDFASQYPLRILIAEDNLVNQKIAVKILTKLGYEPALANNGKEALEIVGNEHFDIILMDVQMPEMNGLEATRMIRTCLENQPIIIALTANAMQGDRDECMQAGMDDYMSKPIEIRELLSQLEKWALVIGERRRA